MERVDEMRWVGIQVEKQIQAMKPLGVPADST
jgi:hypothetical protein